MVQIKKILTHAYQTQRPYWEGLVIMKISLQPPYNLLLYQPLPFYHFMGIYRRTLSKIE